MALGVPKMHIWASGQIIFQRIWRLGLGCTTRVAKKSEPPNLRLGVELTSQPTNPPAHPTQREGDLGQGFGGGARLGICRDLRHELEQRESTFVETTQERCCPRINKPLFINMGVSLDLVGIYHFWRGTLLYE